MIIVARYYPLNYQTFAADLKAALEDYYGSGVTVTKAEDRNITFICPAIFDKPVRITAYQPSDSFATIALSCFVYSDESLASSVTVDSGSSYATGTFYGINLVLAKKFMLIQTGYSDTRYAHSILVARATNGRSFVVSGFNNESNNSARCLFADKMQLTQIRFNMQTTGNAFTVGNRYLLKPTFFGENYELELNEDGTLAFVDGLYSCGRYVTGQPIVGDNYYLSVSGIRGSTSNGIYAPGTFYIGLDTVAM